MKYLLGFAVLMGLLIGLNTGHTSTEYKTRTVTKTVTKIERVEVPAAIPSECRDLARLARQVSKAGDTLDVTSAQLLDILSRTRKAAAEGNTNDANTIETELRGLNSKTIGAVQVLADTDPTIKAAAAVCLGGKK